MRFKDLIKENTSNPQLSEIPDHALAQARDELSNQVKDHYAYLGDRQTQRGLGGAPLFKEHGVRLQRLIRSFTPDEIKKVPKTVEDFPKAIFVLYSIRMRSQTAGRDLTLMEFLEEGGLECYWDGEQIVFETGLSVEP